MTLEETHERGSQSHLEQVMTKIYVTKCGLTCPRRLLSLEDCLGNLSRKSFSIQPEPLIYQVPSTSHTSSLNPIRALKPVRSASNLARSAVFRPPRQGRHRDTGRQLDPVGPFNPNFVEAADAEIAGCSRSWRGEGGDCRDDKEGAHGRTFLQHD